MHTEAWLDINPNILDVGSRGLICLPDGSQKVSGRTSNVDDACSRLQESARQTNASGQQSIFVTGDGCPDVRIELRCMVPEAEVFFGQGHLHFSA